MAEGQENIEHVAQAISSVLNEEETQMYIPGSGEEPPEPGAGGGGGSGEGGGSSGGGNEPPAGSYAFGNIIEPLKKKLGTAEKPYEPPASLVSGKKEDGTELKPEEVLDILHQEITKTIQPKPGPEDDDDFVAEYKAAKKGTGFNREEFLRAKTQASGFNDLPDDEVLFLGTKAQVGDKMTEDQIRDYVKNMDPVDRITRAKVIRDAVAGAQAKKLADEQAANKTKADQLLAQKRAADTVTLDALYKKIATVDNISGLPHGKAEQETFQAAFRDLYDIDPETGNRRYEKLFEDPETLYNALLFVSMHKNGDVMKHLSSWKESYKTSTFEKLGLGQRASDGTVIERRAATPEDFLD